MDLPTALLGTLVCRGQILHSDIFTDIDHAKFFVVIGVSSDSITAASKFKIMIARKLPYILYRDYGEFAYLTDNRNFGYDTFSHSCIKVGEITISHVGSIFYSMLSDFPQDVDNIVRRLHEFFSDVPISVIREDALEFYKLLHSQGFIFCGEQWDDEAIRKKYFSYENTNAFILKISDSELCQNGYENMWIDIPRLTSVTS